MTADQEQKSAATRVPPKRKPKITGDSWAPYWERGLVAFVAGTGLFQLGLWLLDVHLEWYQGIAGFNFSWVLAMSLLPVGTGFVIGVIYGYGGKYLAHFPPAAVMIWSYYSTTYLPQGVHLLPWGMWIMFVILQMEFCAVGAFIGEIVVRRRLAWDSADFQRADSVPLPGDENEQAADKK